MGLKHRTSVTDVLPMTLNATVRLSRHFWRHMRRYKASFNWAYIAADGHELLLKISGQILPRVPHDIFGEIVTVYYFLRHLYEFYDMRTRILRYCSRILRVCTSLEEFCTISFEFVRYTTTLVRN